jgi:hypothetical protein
MASTHILLASLALAATAVGQAAPLVVYRTDFDALTPGVTQPHPGAPGHDGWYRVGATAPAFGAIQSAIAIDTAALQQFTGVTNPYGQQTIDARDLVAPDLGALPIVTLSADVRCRSSDLDAVNRYSAELAVDGGPHPGFRILGLALGAGNTVPKRNTLRVELIAFDGVDNNFLIPTGVGQALGWDTWHRVTVVIDQARDRWVSLTVDGETEDLTGYRLPRTSTVRGQRMDALRGVLVPDNSAWVATDDEVFWDDVYLTASPPGTANTTAGTLLVNRSGDTLGRGPFVAFVDRAGPSAGELSLVWRGPPHAPLVLIGGALHPGAVNLGCAGSLDLGGPAVALLFDGLTPPMSLLFRTDAAGAARQTLWIPGPLPHGSLVALQGLVVGGAPGCGVALTAAFDVDLSDR